MSQRNLFYPESLGGQFYSHITFYPDLAGQDPDAVHTDQAFPAGPVAAAGCVRRSAVFTQEVQEVVSLLGSQSAVLG